MLDIQRILKELDDHVYTHARVIEDCVGDVDDNVFPHSQISLQGVEGNIDPAYGTGTLASCNNTEEEFVVPVFDIPYTNSIIKDLGMTRTRILRMTERSCYSYHRDQTPRIHIPLITNDKCFMVIDDIVHRFPADGNYYIADTTKLHTFVNGSWEDRIHIVGCIK